MLPPRLVSATVVFAANSLVSIKIARSLLASAAAQAGLFLTWSKTRRHIFLRHCTTVLKASTTKCSMTHRQFSNKNHMRLETEKHRLITSREKHKSAYVSAQSGQPMFSV